MRGLLILFLCAILGGGRGGPRIVADAYRIPLNMVVQTNTLLQVPFIMYNSNDAPGSPSDDGSTSIIFDVTASTVLAGGSGTGTGKALGAEPLIEVLVVEESDLGKIGGKDKEGRELACCTEQVRQDYDVECKLDRLFTTSKPQGQFLVQTFPLPANATNKKVRLRFDTNASSIYYLVLSTCEHDSVRIDGYATARNAYGWLPGQYYNELPFYKALLFIYFVIAAFWLYTCFRNRDDIVQVHVWFTLVIIVALVDTILKYLDMAWWNQDDIRSGGLVVIHAISSSLLMTMTLTLVLVLSLGLAVVRPSLGRLRYFVGCFAVTFFLFETARLIVDRFTVTLSHPPPRDIDKMGRVSGDLGQSSAEAAYEAAQSFAYILVLPSAILQAFVYAWIFNGLANTVQDLTDRKQDIKLKLFLSFQNMLMLAGGTVVVWLLAVAAVRATGTMEERYYLVWVLETSPDALYILILVGIILLWRPKTNSKQYALYEQAGTLDNVSPHGMEYSDEDEYLPDELDDENDSDDSRNVREVEMGGMGSAGDDAAMDKNEDVIWGSQAAYESHSDDDDIVA